MAQADRGIAELMESVDTTIVIPNEKLLAVAEDAGFFESFRVADDILRQGVQGISSDIITIPGIINRDFADVKTIIARMGYAVMGTATASGQMRTIEAAQRAIASPLLEAGAIDGARGIPMLNYYGSASLKPGFRCNRPGFDHSECGARGCEHYFWSGARREDERRGEDHCDRHRVPGSSRAPSDGPEMHHSFASTHDDAMGFSQSEAKKCQSLIRSPHARADDGGE